MNSQSHQRYEFGPFQVDIAEHSLLRDGKPVSLAPKVFDLLKVLVQNNGRLVEKDELLKEVWPDSFVEEGNLNRNVSILRKVLGEDAFREALYRNSSQARLSVCRQCEEIVGNGSGTVDTELVGPGFSSQRVPDLLQTEPESNVRNKTNSYSAALAGSGRSSLRCSSELVLYALMHRGVNAMP